MRRITRRRGLGEAPSRAPCCWRGAVAAEHRQRQARDRRWSQPGSTRSATGSSVSWPGRRCADRTELGPARGDGLGARDLRARHRRARARRLLAGARQLPRSSRAAVPVDVPSSGDADRPGARGRCARRFARCGPQAVIQGGDLIDNDQHNELEHALAVLQRRAGPTRAAAATDTSASSSAVEPRSRSTTAPTSTRRATPACCVRRFGRSPPRGLGAAWLPVLGDHDALVAGELVPTRADAVAGGRRSRAVGPAAGPDAAARRARQAADLAGRAAGRPGSSSRCSPGAGGADGEGAGRFLA